MARRIVLDLTEREADALLGCIVALGELDEHFDDPQVRMAVLRAEKKMIAGLRRLRDHLPP